MPTKKRHQSRRKAAKPCPSKATTTIERGQRSRNSPPSSDEPISSDIKTAPHEKWVVHTYWPDLFILETRQDENGRAEYRVEMDVVLDAKFSALCRGITDHETSLLRQALLKIHLLRLGEDEYGELSVIKCLVKQMDVESNITRIDELSLSWLKDILVITELLMRSLSPELSQMVYREGDVAPNALVNRFKKSVHSFRRTPSMPCVKKNNRTYIYNGRSVSLPWLAIICARDFVLQNQRLPKKLELCESVEAITKSKISKASWSDALKSTGLDTLEEAKKFTAKRYQKKGFGKLMGKPEPLSAPSKQSGSDEE